MNKDYLLQKNHIAKNILVDDNHLPHFHRTFKSPP